MGWRLSSIIINQVPAITNEALLEQLGFSDPVKIEDACLDDIMYPPKNKIYIGTYRNNLFIVAAQLPMQFMGEGLSTIEKRLIAICPDAKIGAVLLNSSFNQCGFAAIVTGQKIRAKAGDLDNGTMIDIGTPLPEEEPLLSKSQTDADGKRWYYLDNSTEPYAEHQVGENFVFDIISGFTGIPFSDDDDLLDTTFTGYSTNFLQNTALADGYFSGNWKGHYIYGDGYQESVKGNLVNFSTYMRVREGFIKGEVWDEDKQDDPPSTIAGYISTPFINFLHQYAFKYVIDKDGTTEKDESKPSSIVEYTGLFDPKTQTFKGTWHIENTKYWGTWFMEQQV